MQCAANIDEVRKWIAESGSQANHPVEVCRMWREHRARQQGQPADRPRMKIDEATAQQVREDINTAARDVARRRGLNISDAVIDAIAEARFHRGVELARHHRGGAGQIARRAPAERDGNGGGFGGVTRWQGSLNHDPT